MTRARTSRSPRKAALPRRPGRPSGSAAAADQREQLLDAAVAHYAKQGIANANLRTIAAAAGVTPALIGYYFGGKEALLAAVVDQRLMPAVDELRGALMSAGNDVDALAAGFVRAIHALVLRRPWLPALWIREIVTEGGALRELMLGSVAPKIPRAVAARLAGAQARGRLNPQLDPRLLVVSLIGLTLMPLATASIWRQVFEASDIDDQALQAHTLALLHRALEYPHAS